MALTKVSYSMIQGASANVLDFGAIGDGSADDTAAFQAALDSGANVYIPEGTYIIQNITLNTNGQSLTGSCNSVLKRKANTSNHLISVENDNIILNGFSINGNSSSQVYVYGITEIVVSAANVTVSNVQITDCASFGVYGQKGAKKLKITNCVIENCGDSGIFVNDLSGSGDDPSGGICNNNTVIDFGLNGDGGTIPTTGIGIRSSIGNWRVTNNFVQSTSIKANQQLGIELWTNSNNSIISSNVIDFSVVGSGEFGISAIGKGMVVADNLILGSSEYGIELTDSAASCTGNVIRSPERSGISINLITVIPDSGDIMTVSGNTVENTTYVTTGVAAIAIVGTSGLTPIAATITGNTVHGLSFGIYTPAYLTGYSIVGNTIYNTGSTAPSIVANGTAGVVSGNSIYRVSSAGTGNGGQIIVTGTQHFVNGNKITGNGRIDYGVLVSPSTSYTVVQSNFITGATQGINSQSTEATVAVLNNTSTGTFVLQPANIDADNRAI